MIVTGKFLPAHTEAATGYLEGMIRGERYAFDHPDEAKALAAKDAGAARSPTIRS